MHVIELSTVESLVGEALPRAADEEVAYLVGRFSGRSVHANDADLFRPFTRRDDPETRVEPIGRIVGYVMTGHWNGWHSSMTHPLIRHMIRDAAAQAG